MQSALAEPGATHSICDGGAATMPKLLTMAHYGLSVMANPSDAQSAVAIRSGLLDRGMQ